MNRRILPHTDYPSTDEDFCQYLCSWRLEIQLLLGVGSGLSAGNPTKSTPVSDSSPSLRRAVDRRSRRRRPAARRLPDRLDRIAAHPADHAFASRGSRARRTRRWRVRRSCTTALEGPSAPRVLPRGRPSRAGPDSTLGGSRSAEPARRDGSGASYRPGGS